VTQLLDATRDDPHHALWAVLTMLLESGVPMRVVQEILGHASMVLTADTYSHVTPAFKRQAAPVRHIGEIAVVLAAPDLWFALSEVHCF
jgi:hypothetical protein